METCRCVLCQRQDVSGPSVQLCDLDPPFPFGEYLSKIFGTCRPDVAPIDGHQSDQLFASDALLLGRVTYEEFVASWPLRSGDPFTDRMNSLPKFVASTTLEEPLEWNATLLKGDLAEAVAKLKQQPGQDILNLRQR